MLRFKASASAADARAAAAAMRQLQEVTLAHFEHEEAEVEPISNAHRDAPEVHEIARKFGGASDEGKAAVTREIPGPVVMIVGGVFGLAYRRKIAPVWRA